MAGFHPRGSAPSTVVSYLWVGLRSMFLSLLALTLLRSAVGETSSCAGVGCAAGFEFVTNQCLACTPGSFSDRALSEGCTPCPNGRVASAEAGLRVYDFLTTSGEGKSEGITLHNFDSNDESGLHEEGLRFDGKNDFGAAEAWEFGGGGFSFEAYVRFSPRTHAPASLVEFGSGEDAVELRALPVAHNHQLGVTLVASLWESGNFFADNRVRFKVKNFCTRGVWVHVVWSVTELGVWSVYKDGALIKTLSTDGAGVPRVTTRSNHWIGKTYQDQKTFHGTMRFVAVHERAVVPVDGASTASFAFGLGGATTACELCPSPVPSCSAVVCPAERVRHRFSKLGGLLCPPCTPDEAEPNYVGCLVCSSTEGCPENTPQQQLPGALIMCYTVLLGGAYAYLRWKRRSRRRGSSVGHQDGGAAAAKNDQPSIKGTITLLPARESGRGKREAVLVWSSSLRFRDIDWERRYTEHIWTTRRDPARTFPITMIQVALGAVSVLYLADVAGGMDMDALLCWAALCWMVFWSAVYIGMVNVPISVRYFQGAMVFLQLSFFCSLSAIILTVDLPMPERRFLAFISILQVITAVIIVSSSSVFNLKYSTSRFSCLLISLAYLAFSWIVMTKEKVDQDNEGFFGSAVSRYHQTYEPVTWVIVFFFAKRLLRDADVFQRTKFVETCFERSETNERRLSLEKKVDRYKSDNARMKMALAAAQKLVVDIMQESSAALREYELYYSDIDFGSTGRVALGEGAFGTVYKARLATSSNAEQGSEMFREVAVKTMRVSKISEFELAKFKGELIASIMTPLRHTNLVRLFGGVWNEGADKLCIVLEYCANGSLNTFLRTDEAGEMTGHSRHGLALGTAEGLAYLHHDLKEPLIHRDVKPDNIMVSEGAVAKLADFGESTHFDKQAARRNSEHGNDALTMTMVGTKFYCAPEILAGKRYNESVASEDTFSFSLVLLSLAVGDINYIRKANAGHSTYASYCTGFRPRIPPNLRGTELTSLLERMWDEDMRARPAMREVAGVVARLADCAYWGNASPPPSPAQHIPPSNLLEEFEDVTQDEITAVSELQENGGLDLRAVPKDLGGAVALLRFVRFVSADETKTAAEEVRSMLLERENVRRDDARAAIAKHNWPFHELPGIRDLAAASWHTNFWLATTKGAGDIVAYERLGAIVPARLLAEFPVERMKLLQAYRSEWQSMLLDTLSRRAKRVVRCVFVYDCRGVGLGHRKVLPYGRAIAGGWDATPPTFAGNVVVRVNTIAAKVVNFLMQSILGKEQLSGTSLLDGDDAFAHRSFAAQFERFAMPDDLGGELRSGTEGDCCIGVEHPKLSDEDALWERYVMLNHPEGF